MKPSYYGWGLPFNASADGAAIDRLIVALHIFMAILFVGWFTFLLLTLVKFRARPGHHAHYQLNHFRAPTYLEVGVALVEVFLLFGFSFPIVNQIRNVPPPAGEALQVRVVAEQFAWNIHYPGPDGIFGKTGIHLISPSNLVGLDLNDPAAQDDITTVNQFHVPVNRPVIAHLSSKDVIHSFAIPVMRVKRDVIPGQTAPIWFTAKKTGNFEIACAQLCGLGHYRMRGFFTVETPEAFQQWLDEQTPKQGRRAGPAAPLGGQPPLLNTAEGSGQSQHSMMLGQANQPVAEARNAGRQPSEAEAMDSVILRSTEGGPKDLEE